MYSFIVFFECWSSLEGVFANKWSYCRFPHEVMAVTLALLSSGNLTVFVVKKAEIYNSVHGYVCKSAAVPSHEESGSRSSRYVNMTF